MPNEELISEYIDQAAVTAQTDFFLGKIKELDSAYNALSSKSISLGGLQGSKEITASIQDIQASISKLQATKQQLLSVQGQQAASSSRSEAAARKEAKAVADLSNDYKQLVAAQKDAEARANQLGTVVGKNNPVYKEAAAEAALLKDKIRELNLATGNTSSSIGRYNEGIKEVTVSSGGALAGISKFYGFLRVAANIIPGLGISGIFLAGFEAIKFAAEGLGIFNGQADKTAEKVAKAKKEMADLIDSFRDISEIRDTASGGQEGTVLRVQALASAVTDQTKTYKERNEALLELKNINRAYFGDLTLETASLKTLTALVNEYTEAIINQAVIKELESDIGKVTIAYNKQETQLKATVAQINAAKESLKTYSNTLEAADKVSKLIDLKAQLQDQIKLTLPLRKQYEDLKKEIQEATAAGLKFKPLTSGTGGTTGSERLKTFDAKQDDSDAKRFIELQKQVSAALDVELGSRIALRQSAYSQEYNLLVEATERERQVVRDAANDVLNDPKANAVQKTNARRKLAADLETIDNKFHADELGLEEKFNEDYDRILATARQKRLDDDKKYDAEARELFKQQNDAKLKLLLDSNDTSQSNLKADRDRQLAALEAKRVVDLDNKNEQKQEDEDFNHEKLRIEAEYLRSSLNQNIRYIEALLELRKNQTALTPADQAEKDKQIAAFEAQIKALKLQLAQLKTSQGQDVQKNADEDLDRLIATFKRIQEVAAKISNVIGGALNAYITAQKNALQDQSDQIDANSKKELDAIANSTASEQDKAAKIAIINARTQAQKEQIALRQRQLDQQKAEFDKAANIAKIITATALAVVEALPDIPLAVIAGVLGAAELAVAIATPVPHYRTGTKDHPGGPFVAGDGGKPELVLLPGGGAFVTAATDTMYNAPRGTQVFPDANNLPDELLRLALRPARPLPVAQDGTQTMVNAMAREIKGLRAAVMGRPYHGTHIKDGELRNFVRRDGSYTEYLNRNL
jgi:hypothetical protein